MAIVYVETNWVVGLALPHDRFHPQAVQLLADATKGRCDLRMPVGCLTEGRERARAEMETRPKVLAELRGLLENAVPVGRTCEKRWSSFRALRFVTTSSTIR